MNKRLFLWGLAWTGLTAVAVPGAAVRELDGFTYASTAEARAAWQPKEGAPAPRETGSGAGVLFPCPFGGWLGGGPERVYWDRDGRWDLSAYTSFELELACDNPAAVRRVFLYFRSGGGYYVWSGPPPGAGRFTLLMPKAEFSTEGRPAGWGKVDRIRLAACRGERQNAALTAYDLRARQDTLLVIRGACSIGDPSEKQVARRAARRLSRLLKALDLPHGILDEDELTAASLRPARVVILPYSPRLSSGARAALETFFEAGGKAVVFYSADEALAARMGLKLGPYQTAVRPGQWAAIAFEHPEEWHVPPKVYQTSWNLRPAWPAGKSARVIAVWLDGAGRPTGDPAWLASEQGFWMTHVLLDDDRPAKEQMMLGLLASLDPTWWRRAAAAAVRRAGAIDSFATLDEAASAIRRQARGDVREAVESSLAAAREWGERMAAYFERGDYRGTLEAVGKLRHALTEAYARAQSPRPNEFRGIWDHSGVGAYPGDWARTCEELARAGFTAVFPNLAWGGRAHYPSRYLPGSKSLEYYGDQLAACVRAARAAGLEVHVWKVCWNLENAPPDFVQRLDREGRLQQAFSGRRITWLCPTDPRNRELEISVLREIAQRAAPDGIHLDYIRFPEAGACVCPRCRAAFEKATGLRATAWPADVGPHGRLADAWRRWRADQVTAFVREARAALGESGAPVKLSAAVYASRSDAFSSLGQDWPRWLREGLVDFVCPMSYTEETPTLVAWTSSHLNLPGARGRVYPAIGVASSESQLTADKVIEQIVAIRRLGAPGFVLFKLDPAVRERVLPMLELGVTRR